MEIYNVDQKPLRKKDKEAYYYDDVGNFVRVPSMFDSKKDVFTFVMTCAKKSIPGITEEMIREVWEEAEEKKSIIIDALDQLKREHDSAADYFKSAAYKRAIPQIKSLQIPLLSGEQAQKIKGIGKGIAAHIDEILRAGRLKSVEEREKGRIERQVVVERFTKIWGVSSKTAGEWYSQGLREITDLTDEKLTKQQQVGLKYYEEISQPIPREDVEAIQKRIDDVLQERYSIHPTGSYRRGASEVDVIDIIISTEEGQKIGKALLKKIVKELEDEGVISDAPVFSAKTFMGIALTPEDSYRRINITLVPEDETGALLLHTTGPQAFVTHIKELAAQQGYKLNETGLYKLSTAIDENDEKISVPKEQDIFETLHIDYTDPEDRF